MYSDLLGLTKLPSFSHQMITSPFPAPPGLDAILLQIHQAHESQDEEPTSTAVIASVNYLQRLAPQIHWLCNSSPLLPVVVQAMQLWGYGEAPAQATLATFKVFLIAALARCPDCAMEWYTGCRRELKRCFAEVYLYDIE